MTPLETMLRGWLDDPLASPEQKHHARARLGLPIASDPSPPRPLARHIMAENRLIRACADRDPHCGCDLPTCRAMMGDCDEGGKSSRENCLRCLTAWSLA